MFPLGGSTKDDVRRDADRRGLAVAHKPDSHDICFVADGDTPGWLRERLGPASGPIVDTAGTVVGSHDGAYGFTIGQRRGLRIGTPAADGRPRYVLDIEPVSGTVTVGGRDELAIDALVGIRPRWCGPSPAGPLECRVQLRAHGEEHRAVARLVDDELAVDLVDPAEGVAPGQAVVVYDGTRVVGSATIARTRARQPA
jgi:tRNA-specific 2-thiouridylase